MIFETVSETREEDVNMDDIFVPVILVKPCKGENPLKTTLRRWGDVLYLTWSQILVSYVLKAFIVDPNRPLFNILVQRNKLLFCVKF